MKSINQQYKHDFEFDDILYYIVPEIHWHLNHRDISRDTTYVYILDSSCEENRDPVVGKLPKKYFYTSGLNHPNAYK